jgi:DNA-binding MarR family transcriptional regulator
MSSAASRPAIRVDYQALAAFRTEIRRFLHASEVAARSAGLEPQQHQLLLLLKGSDHDDAATVAWLADRLQLRHHSVVGLIDRLEANGLARRTRDPGDHRRVLVDLTRKGERVLHRLSVFHQQELGSRGPRLIATLTAVMRGAGRGAERGAGRGARPGA